MKDDFYVYFLSTKDEALNCFKNFIKLVDKHSPHGIKIIRSVNALELCSNDMKNCLQTMVLFIKEQ